MIINKKREFFENKLIESIGILKRPWTFLRSLGLPSKTSSCKVSSLRIKNTVEHDVNSVLEGLRNYHSTLLENLVKTRPNHPINTPLTLLLNIKNI